MTPMTPDVPAICAGLTKAQRITLTGKLHEKPGGKIVPSEPAVRKALQRRGLVESTYGFITPTGLAVRAHILNEQQP